MNNEEYILRKLENLSPEEKILSEKIVKDLKKEWVTVKKLADYLDIHINTIYNKIKTGEILSKKIGTKRVIFVPSIILIMK